MSSHTIQHWNPEDAAFWQRQGRGIAQRNLWISILALALAFAVWMVWSVIVVKLPAIGFQFSTNQLFWLAALPGLFGATLRIVYAFMVPIFGGRHWTTLSTASLLPTLGIHWAAQNPETSYAIFVILALLSGLGGANFASSMANIHYFFPKARKRLALGLNAGFGALGVSLVQCVVPLAITAGVFGALGGNPQTAVQNNGQTIQLWLQNAGFIWVPLIIVSTLAAWFGMHDLAQAKASFADRAVIFRRKHTWLMSLLYTGTFGSFIGYSAGLPLLITSQFPAVDALDYAWLGPLIGVLTRPVGGWLADKLGGARVTFWIFLLMTLDVLAVLACLPHGRQGGDFYGFLTAFMVLFASSGIGNGSTFRMIPVIVLVDRKRAAARQGPAAQEQAASEADMETAAVIGFSSAIAAYGAFFIPKSYGSSISLAGGPQMALYAFIVFYVACVLVTWRQYSRRNAPMPC
ncbi:nitrate/nitrite transporter [Thiomonas sp. X19]|uniref:MFS transporter n=1 Tax=Thiomonas sp. X19 TaxID=1050370 RepID=UPI000B75E89E|nr:MFS transporter [Thiomonas sp. X19]SCC95672.1 nitrate/nitrite transporter [Thiomonas sp. X19]